jgi:hypothetical protein
MYRCFPPARVFGADLRRRCGGAESTAPKRAAASVEPAKARGRLSGGGGRPKPTAAKPTTKRRGAGIRRAPRIGGGRLRRSTEPTECRAGVGRGTAKPAKPARLHTTQHTTHNTTQNQTLISQRSSFAQLQTTYRSAGSKRRCGGVGGAKRAASKAARSAATERAGPKVSAGSACAKATAKAARTSTAEGGSRGGCAERVGVGSSTAKRRLQQTMKNRCEEER